MRHLLLVSLLLLGCQGSRTCPTAAAAAAAAAPAATSLDPGSLLGAVPGEAFAVAVLASPRSLAEISGVFVDAPEGLVLAKELGELSVARTGVDLAATRSLSLFLYSAEGQPVVAARLQGLGGEPKGVSVGEAGGAKIVRVEGLEGACAARLGKDLLLGNEAGVRAALETAAGKRQPLDPALAKLVGELAPGSVFVAVADVGRWSPREEIAPLPELGVTRLALAVGGKGARGVLVGSPEGVAKLAGQLRELIATLRQQLEHEKRKAQESADLLTAMTAISSSHYADFLGRVLEPKVEGDRLIIEVAMPLEQIGAWVVPLIGVSAAIAVPAFIKYTRQAKTSEAVVSLRQLADGARLFAAGQPKPGFPVADSGWVPPLGACCLAPGQRCAPSPALWAGSPWRELGFVVAAPSRYSYRFVSDGAGFTAAARGDLDCDGEYSTFELAGAVQADGSVSSAAGIFRDNELE